MPATIDKILGKPLMHTHQLADVGITTNGTLDATSVITVTTNTAAGNDNTLLVNAINGAVTITLPAASTKTNYTYRIKKIDASTNQVIVNPNGTETIDGSTSMIIDFQNSAMDIVSNGTGWYII